MAKSLQMVAWLSDAECQSLIIIVFSEGAAGPRDKKPAVIGWLLVLTKVARKKRICFASVSTKVHTIYVCNRMNKFLYIHTVQRPNQKKSLTGG